jgi:hypothetical protein
MSNLSISYEDGEWLFKTTEGHPIKGVISVEIMPIRVDEITTAVLTFEVADLDLKGVEIESIKVIDDED